MGRAFAGNRENMLKLADGLESGIELTWEGEPVRFDMWQYGDDGCVVSDSTTCGTVGCAIGHATYFVEKKRETEDWIDYTKRLFGPITERQFDYCFGQHWHETDNTREGAAKRIREVLENGVSDDWHDPDGGDGVGDDWLEQ